MRVPIILQHSAVECGAACLAMVLSAHGHRTSVRALAEEMDIGRDGVSALTLVRTARARGLTTRALSTPATEMASIPLPAVAYWRNSHFVVVERVSETRVTIVDPGPGRVRLTHEEFARNYSGVVLTLEAGADFSRGRFGERGNWWVRYSRVLLSRHRGVLVLLALLSVVMQALGLVLPAVTELVVDHVLAAGEIDLLSLLGYGVAAAVCAQLVVGGVRTWALVRLRTRADTALLDDLGKRLLALPFRFFAHRSSSDLVSRISSVSVLREMLTGQALTALLDGPLAVGYMVVVTVRSPLLGGVLIAFAVAQILLLVGTHRWLCELAHREHEARNDAQGQLIEAVRGIETIKASAVEPHILDRWVRLLGVQMRQVWRSGVAQGGQDTALAALRFGAPLTLLWAGAWQVVTHHLSPGTMLGLLALAAATLAPLASLTGSIRAVQMARVQAERLADILDTDPESPSSGVALPPRQADGADSPIELRQVGFRYTQESPWIVRGVDLRVRAGQKIALVGRSGSGKSTLARLLLGLFPPTEGEISYNGVPAGRLDPGLLRRRFGVVTQEPALFTGTIFDNISLGSPEASLDEVAEAARLACVHEDIAAMPMRYKTLLTEGGGLSGGQRQRIALARALLAKPEILLLDEATSHLDTMTEAEIEANLTGFEQTRIVIAHRLSTVRDADVILVVDRGRVVEAGRHEELLAAAGPYARLVDAQTLPGDLQARR
ncbi:peptidase domain-containing ABC transporter [Streptosporangium sp. NPDC002607]